MAAISLLATRQGSDRAGAHLTKAAGSAGNEVRVSAAGEQQRPASRRRGHQHGPHIVGVRAASVQVHPRAGLVRGGAVHEAEHCYLQQAPGRGLP